MFLVTNQTEVTLRIKEDMVVGVSLPELPLATFTNSNGQQQITMSNALEANTFNTVSASLSKTTDLSMPASVGELTEEQMEQFRNQVLTGNLDLFEAPARWGAAGSTTHQIELLPGSQPIREPPRRLGPAQQLIADEAVRDMLNQGVIRESNSPWASPVVLVKKKDGSTRFCVDYRRLNALTRRDAYPLPRLDDALDELFGATFISTLDMKSGYHQIAVDPTDIEKTAFAVKGGHYEFRALGAQRLMFYRFGRAAETTTRRHTIVYGAPCWNSILLAKNRLTWNFEHEPVNNNINNINCSDKLIVRAWISKL